MLSLSPALADAEPTESKAVVEKAPDGSEHAVIMAPVADGTRVGWKADTSSDSRSQDVILQVEKDILSGTFKLDLGSHWGDNVQTTHPVGLDYAVGRSEGTSVEVKATTDLTNSAAGYNLKLDLSQAVTPRLSIVGGLNTTGEFSSQVERSTSLGFGYKLGEHKESLICIGVERDSEGLFEVTSSIKKKFRRWGTLKLEVVRKLQQDSETFYRADYSFKVSERLSVGAEADIQPVANDTPDIGLKANLRVSW